MSEDRRSAVMEMTSLPGARLPVPPTPRGLLAGKTVLVTASAGTGIGPITARRCLEEGARVAICDPNSRWLADTAAELAEVSGEPPLAYTCDVTSEKDVQALLRDVVAGFGHVDVLVNNAGLTGTADVLSMSDEQWSSVLDVTLNGTFRMTRAALQHMVGRGSGAVVNVASVLGWRAQRGQAHYAAAKAGVMALTRCAAMDVADRGVRVNAVAPEIGMDPTRPDVCTEMMLSGAGMQEASRRAAEPWEVANVIVFLASDYSTYLTGEVVSVGGQHP